MSVEEQYMASESKLMMLGAPVRERAMRAATTPKNMLSSWPTHTRGTLRTYAHTRHFSLFSRLASSREASEIRVLTFSVRYPSWMSSSSMCVTA